MKILTEINDATVGLGTAEQLGSSYELRKSARAILKKSDGTIAVQYIARSHFHKLPGGGVESGESIEEGLIREIKEEVGCGAHIVAPLGVVIEYRNEHRLIQISYCFVAGVLEPFHEPTLEQAEIDEGLTPLWMNPHEALAQMEIDQPTSYQGHFILKREIAFLKEYLKMIET